jgi:high-affinity iron transporter
MLSAFLITLREGLEAALIIAIITAYLARTGNRQWFKHVWLGMLLAVLVSVIVGAAIYLSAGKLEGRAEEIFEGITMLIATGVLTWMIFWMRKQAANIKGQLRTQIDLALGKGSARSLVVLAFVAVTREGIETVLFLFAAARVAQSLTSSAIGGFAGLAVAIGVGYGIYKGTSKLNLRAFFNATSIALILFAAGLLAHGIHEFHEADLIPPIVEHVWDINHVLAEKSAFGEFLTGVFGYNANPSLVEVVAYFSYLTFALAHYLPAVTGKLRKSVIRYRPNREGKARGSLARKEEHEI